MEGLGRWRALAGQLQSKWLCEEDPSAVIRGGSAIRARLPPPSDAKRICTCEKGARQAAARPPAFGYNVPQCSGFNARL